MDFLVVASSWSPVVHLRSMPRIILTSEFGKFRVLFVIETVGPDYSCCLRKIDRVKAADDRPAHRYPRIIHHPELCNRINRLLFSGPTGSGAV